MLKVRPAMVREPLCALLLPFAFTVNDTVPLPLPLVPAEICTKPELLLALQPQPDGAVTFTLPLPPPEPKEADVADSEYVQPAPASGGVDGTPAVFSAPLCAVLPPVVFTAAATDPLP